jgi:hypothetical protein
MIWFACKKCGQKHSRPESSAGTMVFCSCGQGITVPWESTIEAPENPDPPPLPAARPASLPEPLPLPPSRSAGPSSPPPAPRLRPIPVGEERVPPGARPRPRPAARPHDPDHCFNHPDMPTHHTCAACELGFCTDCVILFKDERLCGPCKNFRVRQLQQASQRSTKATIALALALLTVPLAILVPWTLASAVPILCFFLLLPQLVALLLGSFALYQAERTGRGGGRSFALSSILTASASGVLTIAVYLLAR